MKKGNIIEFAAPRTQQQASAKETHSAISKELEAAIRELIQRMRLGLPQQRG